MLAVVIPLYNKGPHIASTLNAVLAQTLPAAEIIVVDDGSTDNGPDVVQQYVKRGVHLVRQSNQGVSVARNTGLQLAESAYVAFLDADDQWEPNHLATLAELITLCPTAALLSTAHVIRREGQLIHPRSGCAQGWLGQVDDFFLAFSKGLSLVNSSTACVRKDSLMAVGGFPVGMRRGEDVVAWMELALQYPVAHAARVTAVFNQEAVNRSDVQHETELPGSLLYMHKQMTTGGVPSGWQLGFCCLFDQLALVTAANFRLKGDFEVAKAIARLAYGAKRYKVAGLIAFVNFLPSWVLRFAKKYRHSFAQSQRAEK
jgi:glycosyltransferase involved in cell wall biosynthesis